MSLNNLFSLVGSAFCCVVLFIMISAMSRRSRSVEQRALQAVYYCAIVYMLAELAWSFVDGHSFPYARELNYFINMVDYIMITQVGYRWFVYYELHTPSALTATRARRIAWKLPMFVLAALILSTGVTGWLFTVGPDNLYRQGPLFYVQLAGSYIYPVAVSLKGSYYRRRADTTAERSIHMVFSMYALIAVVFEAVNILTVERGIYIHCYSITALLLYQFVNQQEQQITRDYLTKMNNRGALENYIKNGQHDDENDYLLMLDVNHFKYINDQYGHNEGDRALIMTADALKRIGSRAKCFIARYGGDEFVIVCDAYDEQRVVELCGEIRESVAKLDTGRDYKLSVSVGYARRTPGETTAQWLRAADEMMYREKGALGIKR